MSTHLARGSPEYTALFDDFEYTAYRLETLQHYAGDDEAGPLRQFLAGGDRPHDPGRDKWAARVRAAAATGKVMQRVHIVMEPLSDYVRYELEWSYTPEAGEDIRIIPAAAGDWPQGLPRHDYWLFDSARLLRMHYDDNGRMTSAELDEDPAEISKARHWRDIALRVGVPLGDYMRRRLEPTP